MASLTKELLLRKIEYWYVCDSTINFFGVECKAILHWNYDNNLWTPLGVMCADNMEICNKMIFPKDSAVHTELPNQLHQRFCIGHDTIRTVDVEIEKVRMKVVIDVEMKLNGGLTFIPLFIVTDRMLRFSICGQNI